MEHEIGLKIRQINPTENRKRKIGQINKSDKEVGQKIGQKIGQKNRTKKRDKKSDKKILFIRHQEL